MQKAAIKLMFAESGPRLFCVTATITIWFHLLTTPTTATTLKTPDLRAPKYVLTNFSGWFPQKKTQRKTETQIKRLLHASRLICYVYMKHKCGSATKKQMSTATVKYFVSTKATFPCTARNNFLAFIHQLKHRWRWRIKRKYTLIHWDSLFSRCKFVSSATQQSEARSEARSEVDKPLALLWVGNSAVLNEACSFSQWTTTHRTEIACNVWPTIGDLP